MEMVIPQVTNIAIMLRPEEWVVYRYTLVQATDSASGDWDLNAGETVQLQRHVAVVVVMVWWCWGW